MPSLEQVLGPFGALVLALAVIGFLGRDHQRADARERARGDSAIADARALTKAVDDVATSYIGLAKEVQAITRELAAVRRDMAARRKAP